MKKWLLLLLAAVPLTIYLVACNCGDKDDLIKSPGESDDTGEDTEPLTAGMTGSAAAAPASTSTADEPYTGEWIYLTASGSKYHRPDCQHVEGKSNLRKMTRVEASGQGFAPCKTCEPGQQ